LLQRRDGGDNRLASNIGHDPSRMGSPVIGWRLASRVRGEREQYNHDDDAPRCEYPPARAATDPLPFIATRDGRGIGQDPLA